VSDLFAHNTYNTPSLTNALIKLYCVKGLCPLISILCKYIKLFYHKFELNESITHDEWHLISFGKINLLELNWTIFQFSHYEVKLSVIASLQHSIFSADPPPTNPKSKLTSISSKLGPKYVVGSTPTSSIPLASLNQTPTSK